jgi:hypothetical protein
MNYEHHCFFKMYSYPLVNIQKAIEHGPVEIVDLPLNKMVIFPSVFCMFTRPGNSNIMKRSDIFSPGDCQDAGVEPKDINEVLLVGGMTRMPKAGVESGGVVKREIFVVFHIVLHGSEQWLIRGDYDREL